MTADEYWNGDPSWLTDYHRAYVERERRRMSDMDTEAWLHGMYACHAHGVALGNAFHDRKRGGRRPEYVEKPMYYKEFLDRSEREAVEEREREQKLKEMERRFAKMAARVRPQN